MTIAWPRKDSVFNSLSAAPLPVRQALLGVVYVLMPRRLRNLPSLVGRSLRDWIRRTPLPHASDAMERPDGLCALAGSLQSEDILEGYRRGMFALSHVGPLKWWAPAHRMVLFFDQARIEKTTRRLLKGGRFTVTFDRAFADVMRACAAPRPGRIPLTWITPRMQGLFGALHAQGHAHSVEVWQDGELVGGLYGLSVGKVFFTESQFHTARDASKVGFAVLNRHLQAWGYALNDGKHATPYLVGAGCRGVTRNEFTALTMLYATQPGRVGNWTVDAALGDGNWEPASAPGMTMRDLLPEGSACRWTPEQMLVEGRSNNW